MLFRCLEIFTSFPRNNIRFTSSVHSLSRNYISFPRKNISFPGNIVVCELRQQQQKCFPTPTQTILPLLPVLSIASARNRKFIRRFCGMKYMVVSMSLLGFLFSSKTPRLMQLSAE